jgi:aspartate/methionine/tyrosine aminotransferase
MKISDFRLERFFSRHEFSTPYLLCSSDCETLSVGELLAMEDHADERLKSLSLGYTETQGHEALRAEVARLYRTMTPEDIIIFSGAEEGIFVVMNVLLDRGDHAIVQSPAYQSLYEVASSLGCGITYWPLREEHGWQPDIDLLSTSAHEKAKVIIINNPHNPTGFLMSHEELDRVIEIARKHDSIIFSDEVYRLLEYDVTHRLPAICDCYEKGISLGVMSKSFGLAGLRIGWIACKDREIQKKALAFKDYTTICNSAPAEFLAILALKHRDRIVGRNVSLIKRNCALLRSFLKDHGALFSWVEPKAGPIAFPRLNTGRGIEEFCGMLVKEMGVLLLPGTQYDFDDCHFRIGYGRENMPSALAKLEEFLRISR